MGFVKRQDAERNSFSSFQALGPLLIEFWTGKSIWKRAGVGRLGDPSPGALA